ncbi:ribonuclease P protein component [Marinilactibacillus sp. Marseille-P9653]|uniref:ribonuclease P protein component n=1 Tax=Marinilactibacillus sp. Marseille-P9653 TaxID=2866583 RepID=UPI001CE4137E|nr:ribonuclease P protein component [Marinilactibacillus sp. Marseille-P9653]
MRKAYRVKKEADFQKVFHKGKSVANRQFVVYVLEKPDQAHFRVGISVSKKLGHAPTRNAVKRKIRHALTEFDQENLLKQERDFLVIARNPATSMSYVEVKKSLLHVLKLAKMTISE